MILNTRARYSLRMMVEVADGSDDECPINLSDVSLLTGISRRYLEQLAMPLRRAGLLAGRTGRNGGHRLARPPEEIGLTEVLEAASCRVSLAECVDDDKLCPRSPGCRCRLLYTLLTLRIRNVLDGVTLAELGDLDWLRAEVARERKEGARLRAARDVKRAKED